MSAEMQHADRVTKQGTDEGHKGGLAADPRGRGEKWLGVATMLGGTVLLLGTALWLFAPQVSRWMYAAGAVVYVVARFAGRAGDWRGSADPQIGLTLRRLHGMHAVGCMALLASALFMWLGGGFHLGMYITRAFWLIPFVAFVVIELYTAFRIPAEEKAANR